MNAIVVWLTGIPASGKSSIAFALKKELTRNNIAVEVLESDEIRRNLYPYLSYDERDRKLFYQSLTYIADLLVQNHVNVVIAATASRREYRDAARGKFKNFVEVYIKCQLETCIKRDRKGFYEATVKGEKPTFPIFISEDDDPTGEYSHDRDAIRRLFPSCGVYEPPKDPEVVVDSSINTPTESARIILEFLEDKALIRKTAKRFERS